MLLIGKARHAVIGLGIEMRGLQPPFGDHAKHGERGLAAGPGGDGAR